MNKLEKSLVLSGIVGTTCYFYPKIMKKAFPSLVQNSNASNWRYKVRKFIWKIENIHPYVKHYLRVTIPENLWITGSLITFYLSMDEFKVSTINSKDIMLLFYTVNVGCFLMERSKNLIKELINRFFLSYSNS